MGGCVHSLLFDLRPNCGWGNEDNDLLQNVQCMQCHTQCPRPCSRPLLTHVSAGDSWTFRASLGQSLVGSLLLSPGSWFAQVFVCALQEPVSPVLCNFCQLCDGVNGDILQEGLCHTQVCCTQSPCPCSGHFWPVPLQETLKHSKAGLAQSLWGLLMHTRFCLSPLSISGGFGFDSKSSFAPPPVLLGLPLCLWMWAISFFLVGSSILLLMVVQQRVVILEFSQEKMSSCPSTLPS